MSQLSVIMHSSKRLQVQGGEADLMIPFLFVCVSVSSFLQNPCVMSWVLCCPLLDFFFFFLHPPLMSLIRSKRSCGEGEVHLMRHTTT